MGRERRAFERIDSLVNIKYQGRSYKAQGNSLSRDVSKEGVGMPVNSRIPPGTTLDLNIILEKNKREEIIASAKVVWSRRNEEHWKPRYSAGLKFLEISSADQDRLVRYAGENRWVKSDFERSLEENKIPVLGRRGEFAI